jgi:hypothetical protein
VLAGAAGGIALIWLILTLGTGRGWRRLRRLGRNIEQACKRVMSAGGIGIAKVPQA